MLALEKLRSAFAPPSIAARRREYRRAMTRSRNFCSLKKPYSGGGQEAHSPSPQNWMPSLRLPE